MCGIFGYVGEKDPLNICLDGLERLEYRGYDSSGIGGIHAGRIAICKAKGMLKALKEKASLPKLDVAIGHTRWATHGKVDDENAHPFTDASESFALIHNGIIENYKPLKESLLKEGVCFSSETDSEVIVNLIAKHYDGNILSAVQKTLPLLKGSYAILVIHKDHPEEIIAAANECPLSIGWTDGRKETVISSDPNAFQGPGFEILFLEKKEVARVRKGDVEIFDALLKTVKKKTERLEGNLSPPTKEGFEHFMLKEIFEQPRVIQNTLLGRSDANVFFSELKLDPTSFQRFSILGCGSSAHAGLIASYLMEDLSKVDARVEIASEARYRTPMQGPETLTIAVSQSGETADLLAALRETKKQGAKTLALCNVKNSTLVRESESFLSVKAGPEISVCSTKAFTAQLSCLTLFSLHFADFLKKIPKVEITTIYEALLKIPSQIEEVLKRKDEIEQIAKKYAAFDDFIFLGRNYMLPTAMEAALKLKEISYTNANAYPAGELKHGAIALLDENFPVIAFCANERTLTKMTSNLLEVKARKAPIFAIAAENATEIASIADDVFFVPMTLDPLSPFCSSVVGQLFAYYVAKERGCDIDHPRNLAKSVTVE